MLWAVSDGHINAQIFAGVDVLRRVGDVRTETKMQYAAGASLFSENDIIPAPFLNLFDEDTLAI